MDVCGADVWVPLAGSLGQHAIEIAALHSSTSEADELGMVDVFGGAGCVSLGFKKAGFQVYCCCMPQAAAACHAQR